LGYFRDVMATAVCCPADSLLHVSPAERAGVQESAGKHSLESILASLQILDQSISRLKYMSHPRIVAELALVRICRLDEIDALPQLIAELRKAGGADPAPGVAPAEWHHARPSVPVT
jgi:DNA polymerase-3 subunit gamma/tau